MLALDDMLQARWVRKPEYAISHGGVSTWERKEEAGEVDDR